MSNPGRKCIFCQEKPGNSKEHLWGKWLSDLVAIPTNQNIRGNHTITRIDPSGNSFAAPGNFTKPGHVLSLTTRVVCKQCNNTWMSSIEHSMKKAFMKFFYRLRMAHSSFLEIETIDAESKTAIAKWLYLKFLLFEYSYPPDEMLSNYEGAACIIESERAARRRSFFERQEIPGLFRAFVCRTVSRAGEVQYGHNHLCAVKASADLKIFKEVSSCLIEVGPLSGIVTNQFPVLSVNPFYSLPGAKGAPIFEIFRTNQNLNVPTNLCIHTEVLDQMMRDLWNVEFPGKTREIGEVISRQKLNNS